MLTSLKGPRVLWNGDGTPFSPVFGDVYFSSDDGEAESRYVFLEGCDLPNAWAGRGRYTIAETGFGTGLNFLLAWQAWRRDPERCGALDYVSIEAFPMSREELGKALGLFPHLSEFAQALLEVWPPASPGVHVLTFEAGRVRLHLWFDDVGAALSQMSSIVDAWFLDGFAPSRNPSMWQESVLRAVAALSVPGTRLASFTVAGDVRRVLSALGFSVCKRPGYGRKRHCMTARFIEASAEVPSRSPLFVRPHALRRGARIAVIGAGIAGCSVAFSLRRAGFEPIVIDRVGRCGTEASGNPCALVKPRLSLDQTPRGRFHTQAFLHAVRCLEKLHAQGGGVILSRGALFVARDTDECIRMKRCVEISSLEGVEYVDATRAALLAQVEAPLGGVWCPQALAIDPRRVCQSLLDNLPITRGEVSYLERQGLNWVVHMDKPCRVDAVILAAGPHSARLWPGAEIPLHANRGYVTWISDEETLPSHAVSFGGYISSAVMHEGQSCRILGATYDRWNDLDDVQWRDEHPRDVQRVLEGVSRHLPSLSKFIDARSCLGGRRALRATTCDHLPLVGPLFRASTWREVYGDFHHRRIRKPYPESTLEEGLFLLSGLGSHGFQTAFLAADILASLCAGGALPIELDGWGALHPARFLMREMRRCGSSL